MENQESPTISPDVRIAARKVHYQENPEEFFKSQLKIRTKEIGYSPFVLNAVQIPVLKSVRQQLKRQGKIRQLWFKGRQVGASTLAAAITFHKASLFPGVSALAVAQDKVTSARLFAMLDLFYKSMEQDIRPNRSYFTKGTELIMGFGKDEPGSEGIISNLLCCQGKEINLSVGATHHCLWISEIARYPSSAPITESLLPACSDAPGTIRIWESTAHFGGASDYFREQCLRAMDGRGEYVYNFLPWWLQKEYQIPLAKGERFKLDAHSDYPNEKHLHKKVGLTLPNLKWRRSKIDELGGDVDLFYLSYPTDFQEGWITRDSSAFPYGRLTEQQANLRPPIERFTVLDGRLYADPEGLLYVWKKPEPNKTYDIGADVAGGDGSTDRTENAKAGDFSVAEVVERGSLEQCAEWRGHVLPREFGDILAAIGRFYNTAQIANEVNTFGMSTLGRLQEMAYPSQYLWRKRDGIGIKFTGKVGWVTSYESKNLIVNLMREKLYYRQVVIHSRVLWDEMRNFVRDFTPTGLVTYSAAVNYDDCVMAFCIAVQTSEDENFDRYHQQSVRTEAPPKEPPVIDATRQDLTWQDELRDYGGQNDMSIDLTGWR